MKAGIISAGLGERLKERYPGLPKPMVPVAGRPLIDWTVIGLQAAGVRDVTILFNTKGRPARLHLEKAFPEIRWTFLEKDTPSSWESFKLVAGKMAKDKNFLISTVDAIISPDDVKLFSRSLETMTHEAAMAVTKWVDDENPLWADTDYSSTITGIGPDAKNRMWVTCGLYGLTPAFAGGLLASERSYNKLREFWTSAVRHGRRILGLPLAKTLDIDRPEDVQAAEEFLEAFQR